MKPLQDDMDAQRRAQEFIKLCGGHKVGSSDVDRR